MFDKPNLRKVLVSTIFIFLFGCATSKAVRPASMYLLSTEKPQTRLIGELAEMLKNSRYEIKSQNAQTGFLILKPRRFGVKRADGSKTSVEQNLIIRQEGGSITIRANYDCEYSDQAGGLEVGPCENDDAEVNARIRRIEAALLKQINQQLEAQSATPLEKDLTVEPSKK